jgi:hypothetical protein
MPRGVNLDRRTGGNMRVRRTGVWTGSGRLGQEGGAAAYRCRGLPAYIGGGSVWTVLGRRNEKPHLGPVFSAAQLRNRMAIPIAEQKAPACVDRTARHRRCGASANPARDDPSLSLILPRHP